MPKRRFHEEDGPSQRQLRVGELIRRALADIFARGDLHDPDLPSTAITVGEVRMSPDLRIASIYVMPLGGGNIDQTIKSLANNKSELRRQLARAVHLKYSPDLRFLKDDTFDQMAHTNDLLNSDHVRRDLTKAEADDMAADIAIAKQDGEAG